MLRVKVKPELLRWARNRVGRSVENLGRRFKKLAEWECGESQPTLKQLEAYAKATYVPIGYLFLPTPPEERVPIPDLRTIRNQEVSHPSPDLLDTIYICQQRQVWYRDYAQAAGHEPLRFVGSVNRRTSVEQTAEQMRKAMGFDIDARRECRTWGEALRLFIEQTDDLGILIMISGVVGSNNRRRLDTEEFRGFALSDEYAPLIFINGSDTKSAQMFTLAHELAHLWLGVTALSDIGPASYPSQQTELWCNRVAAEFLVPLGMLRDCLPKTRPLDAVAQLARRFKVSTLVILRRIFDADRIDRDTFRQAYDEEMDRLLRISKSSGGDYYLTTGVRVSRRFARALIADTLEGQTLYRDAFQMLGIKKEKTFREFGRNLGCAI